MPYDACVYVQQMCLCTVATVHFGLFNSRRLLFHDSEAV